MARQRPIVDRPADDKHPAAARFADRCALFWETYDPNETRPQRRPIAFMTRPVNDTTWSNQHLGSAWGRVHRSGDAERRRPVLAIDGAAACGCSGRNGPVMRWEIKYNRHTAPLAPERTEITCATDRSRIEDDLFLLTRPSSPDKRLWLFGARRTAIGGPAASPMGHHLSGKGQTQPQLMGLDEAHTFP